MSASLLAGVATYLAGDAPLIIGVAHLLADDAVQQRSCASLIRSRPGGHVLRSVPKRMHHRLHGHLGTDHPSRYRHMAQSGSDHSEVVILL